MQSVHVAVGHTPAPFTCFVEVTASSSSHSLQVFTVPLQFVIGRPDHLLNLRRLYHSISYFMLPEAGALYRKNASVKRHSMNKTAISNDMRVCIRDYTRDSWTVTRSGLLQACTLS